LANAGVVRLEPHSCHPRHRRACRGGCIEVHAVEQCRRFRERLQTSMRRRGADLPCRRCRVGRLPCRGRGARPPAAVVRRIDVPRLSDLRYPRARVPQPRDTAACSLSEGGVRVAAKASSRVPWRTQIQVRRVRSSPARTSPFLQRFGGALNLNVHFHSLVLDGVYEVLPASRGVRFLELPPPDTHEVLRVLADTVERLVSALRRCGYGSEVDADGEDDLSRDNPVMAALYAAAVQGRIAMGADAGQRITRLGNAALAVDPVESGSSRCATLAGFSFHAGVAIGANDRAGLERVCRYMGRPALACERLERLNDGRILYRLRQRWRDGTSAHVFEPRDFLARLAAQVPPPRAHQVRYHGVLGPCAAWRPYVVPAASDGEGNAGRSACSHDKPQASRARSIAWSDLLRRVFAVDALRCDRCGSKMRVMTAMRSPTAVAGFPACSGRAGRSPPATGQGESAA